MSFLTNYAANKLVDAMDRGQTLGAPATKYYALMLGKGRVQRSTAYASGDYVVPDTSNGRVYKCTAAGTTGASAPTWPTAKGGTVADGTVTWTEASADLEAGSMAEVSTTSTGYGRVAIAASLANFAGTQGPGTTVASSGTSDGTSNNVSITFGSPTGSWQAAGQQIIALAEFDAATAGNMWKCCPLDNPKTVNSGDPAPSFAAAAVSFNYNG